MRVSRKSLEREGYSFIWAYSAYRCCVRKNGVWIGTFNTQRAYQIPYEAITEAKP